MDWGHIEEHFHPKHGMSALKDSRARGQRPIKDQLASNWSSFDLQLIFNWSSIDLFPIDLKLLGNDLFEEIKFVVIRRSVSIQL